MSEQEKLYYDQKEAEAFLKALGLPVKASTLATRASRGGGPDFFRFGQKRLYTAESLRVWAQQLTTAPCKSASEAKQRAGEGRRRPLQRSAS